MGKPEKRKRPCPGTLLEVGDFALGVNLDTMQSIRDFFEFEGTRQVFPDVPAANILAYCYVFSIERLLRDMVWLAGNSLAYDFASDQGFNEAWCSFRQLPADQLVSHKIVTILDCVLLKDLKGTMKRRKPWNAYFKETFGSPARLERFFDGVIYLRNHVAHFRGMGPDELRKMEQLRNDLMVFLKSFLQISHEYTRMSGMKRQVEGRLSRPVSSLKMFKRNGVFEIDIQCLEKDPSDDAVLGNEKVNRGLQEYLGSIGEVFFYSTSSTRLLLFSKALDASAITDVVNRCTGIVSAHVDQHRAVDRPRRFVSDDRKFLHPRHPFVARRVTGWPFEYPGNRGMVDLARYINELCTES